jgi:3-oxoacyl-[acyl-carrier protein] reductase
MRQHRRASSIAPNKTFGHVDILINNAAHCVGDTFISADDSRDWGGRRTVFIDALSIDRHFTVNVRATALLIAEFARRYVARAAKWGRIISITTGGAECFPGEVSYGASKNALETYTRAAGKELARFGVTANLIVPGATQTGWTTPELEKIILPDVPARRTPGPPPLGQPTKFAERLIQGLERNEFYILCQDNETTRDHDERRILWAAGDLVENRPALSR